MSKFEQESISVAGQSTIWFHFAGDIGRAGLVGAELYAELRADGGADMRIKDASGEVLADVVVNPRSHVNITENVIAVGSALLWSHERFVNAQMNSTAEPSVSSPSAT